MSASPQLIASSGDSLREAFGKALTAAAADHPNVVVLDADIAGGTGVHHFRKAHPDRFFQFGIAEQNMMAAAGGMAATGLIPVVTTFAVFCLRAIEQARLSIAYAKRNVKIVASHPGLDVGPDGGSAQKPSDGGGSPMASRTTSGSLAVGSSGRSPRTAPVAKRAKSSWRQR